MTLEEFVQETQFTSRNFLFDRAMFSLFDDLARITEALAAAGTDFELVGGIAVLAHILDRNRSRSFVTRDIDILIGRGSLDRLVEVAESAGYEGRRIVGGYMLIREGQTPAEAVHIIFAGERSKSTQPIPHPAVAPVRMQFFGLTVPVAPLEDLVRMKLNSFRAKDIAHLETLDEAGLITATVESALPEDLAGRLRQARLQWLAERPDVE
ncbi:MAG: nucleotidyltransferase family protein [Acidobacteria bacterium]|nr:nucleotidyltransferase family protein [Acidobacteriota bacterium]